MVIPQYSTMLRNHRPTCDKKLRTNSSLRSTRQAIWRFLSVLLMQRSLYICPENPRYIFLMTCSIFAGSIPNFRWSNLLCWSSSHFLQVGMGQTLLQYYHIWGNKQPFTSYFRVTFLFCQGFSLIAKSPSHCSLPRPRSRMKDVQRKLDLSLEVAFRWVQGSTAKIGGTLW